MPLRFGGIVLCGGMSRRMGRAKEWLDFGGRTLLQRVVEVVSAAVDRVVVAARPGQLLPPLPAEVQIVHDRHENCGPLAGLEAGMTALERDCDAVLVASCDHPLLTTEIVKLLRNALGDAPAAVPIHQGESVPTLAVYRQSVRAVLDDTIKSHDYSFRRFAERCRATWVPSESLRDSDPDLDCLINVNDPIEYERALRQWNAGRSAGRV